MPRAARYPRLESLAAETRPSLGDTASYSLLPMQAADLREAQELAQVCFSPKVLPAVRRTLEDHEASCLAGLNDGRRFLKLVHDNSLIGVCGLHKYPWDPSPNCWASWFFLAPAFRRNRYAFLTLALGVIEEARTHHYRRLFVETYSPNPKYSSISQLLLRAGFQLQTQIRDYYEPGVHLQILSADLKLWPRSAQQ